MSTVHVHIGQCGNQLSIPLWKNYSKFRTSRGSEQVYFSLDGWQRSVHIDSEPKVLKSLPHTHTHTFTIRESNLIKGKRGRGTNFALGYSGMRLHNDDRILEESIEAVRKEIERCDVYSGTIVYHSLSGGTGSGLGAHMIELLKENFPCHHIISCAVAACASGESPLQNYNALLSLHWLQKYADAVIVLPNDYYIKHLNQILQSESEENFKDSQISFKDINSVVANNLCGLFTPTDTFSTLRGTSLGQEPWESMRMLTPMPSTKFISLSQHTSKKLSWEALTSKILQYNSKYIDSVSPTQTISAITVARGDRENTFKLAIKSSLDKKIRKELNCVKWNTFPLDIWTSRVNTIGSLESRSVTLAVNSNNVLSYFQTVLSHSSEKLRVGAYTHWYYRNGISQDIFDDAKETLNQLISDYESTGIGSTLNYTWPLSETNQFDTTLFESTQGNTTLSEQTQGSTTLSEQTQKSTTLSEQTQGRTTFFEPTHGSITLSEQTHGSTALSEQTHGSTALSEQTQGSTALSKQTQGSTTLAEQTKGYTTLAEQTSGSTTTISESTSSSDFVQNTTAIVDVVLRNTTTLTPGKSIKEDPAATCAHFLTSYPYIINEIRSTPKCTHRGVIFDEFTRLVEQFDSQSCSSLSSQEKQSQTFYCSIVIKHQMCLQDEGKEFDTETIPTYSSVKETIRALCFLNQTLPRECLFRHLKDVKHCVMQDVRSVLEMENQQWHYGSINICKHFEIKTLCMWEELKPCGEKTASSMTSLIGVLMKPPVCSSNGFLVINSHALICLNLIVVLISYFSLAS